MRYGQGSACTHRSCNGCPKESSHVSGLADMLDHSQEKDLCTTGVPFMTMQLHYYIACFRLLESFARLSVYTHRATFVTYSGFHEMLSATTTNQLLAYRGQFQACRTAKYQPNLAPQLSISWPTACKSGVEQQPERRWMALMLGHKQWMCMHVA